VPAGSDPVETDVEGIVVTEVSSLSEALEYAIEE
jgi:hypothetical protein